MQFASPHLLGVTLLEGEHGGDVEHDLDAPPLRVDAVGAGEVVDGVEAALVAVEALEADGVAEHGQEVEEGGAGVVVAQDLLFRELRGAGEVVRTLAPFPFCGVGIQEYEARIPSISFAHMVHLSEIMKPRLNICEQ